LWPMLRLALCLLLLGSSVATATAAGHVEAWLATSDSLRALGQDAASLDLLKSAQHEYEKEGDPCSAALLAGRRAEVHGDWKNPLHADLALSEAIQHSLQCPDLSDDRVGWRLALAKANLEQGKRKEARELLLMLARMIEAEGTSDHRLGLAVEAMTQLAEMAFEEGSYAEAESDHLSRASTLLELDRRMEAAEALGWAAVCRAMEHPGDVPDYWASIPANPSWQAIPLEERVIHGVEWGRILLEGRALSTFDALGSWPWAEAVREGNPDVSAEWDARWALLQARRWRKQPTQALAASLHAELAARVIEDAERREPLLVEALRIRSGLLAETGAHGPAYHALAEADSLSRAMLRAERARTGLFESEPWLAAIGDARTALEAQRAEMWQWAATAAMTVCLLLAVWLFRVRWREGKAHSRLRRLQQQWIPGKQHQIDALAQSGHRIAQLAGGLALPADMRRELADFGRLTALCSQEMEHEPIPLEALCVALCEARSATGSLDWTVREEVPFRGDQRHLMDFLQVLLEGVGQGPCRMALTSAGDGLTIELDGFTEKGWWRQAMSLFAGDAKAEHWSMIRMRCDRLGGRLDLDCDAAGARALTVSLPVYSA
jgi:hypothetical protein